VTTIVHSTCFEGGFALEQLENERNEIYYRACKDSICRYAEDEYIARMYLEGMGWDPMQPPLPEDQSTPQFQPPAVDPKNPAPETIPATPDSPSAHCTTDRPESDSSDGYARLYF